jgi:hypothetical protein
VILSFRPDPPTWLEKTKVDAEDPYVSGDVRERPLLLANQLLP